jgi:formylglycine-generating enzyme required for sulfatase activity
MIFNMRHIKNSILFFAALILLSACTQSTPPTPPPPGMVKVPKGEFMIGSDKVDTEAKGVQYGNAREWYANERPSRKISLNEYYIDTYEVTNANYKEFVDATGHRIAGRWETGTYAKGTGEHPVTNISWDDAVEFCAWKSKRLPTEAEWEKAARGTDGREFPWGNEFDKNKATSMGLQGGTTPVGLYEDGKSPYGAYDMAGNAWEWTSDWYKRYPNNDYDDEAYGEQRKVVRGGGWGGLGHYTLQVNLRTSFRNAAPPKGGYNDVGFRCAWSDESK